MLGPLFVWVTKQVIVTFWESNRTGKAVIIMGRGGDDQKPETTYQLNKTYRDMFKMFYFVANI